MTECDYRSILICLYDVSHFARIANMHLFLPDQGARPDNHLLRPNLLLVQESEARLLVAPLDEFESLHQ